MSEPLSKPLFEEVQYLGRNSFLFNRRMVLAVFCFLAYFIGGTGKQTSDLFLIVGSAIVVISIALAFIPHFTVKVFETCIVIDGLWSTSKVKIDLNSIISAEKTAYSNFLLNNPVYNLHKKGTIRFYSGGKEAVKLTDRDGLIYMIGIKNCEALISVIEKQLKR